MRWVRGTRPVAALSLALAVGLAACVPPAGTGGGAGVQGAAAAAGAPPAVPPAPLQAEAPATGPYVGQAAPALAGQLAAGGDPFSLAALQGKVVFLNFFATWCGPCRAEMPVMEDLHRQLGGKVAIVAVGADPAEGPEELAAFAAELGLTFPVVHASAPAAGAYRIAGIPTSLFIDRAGIVRARADWMLDADSMLQGLQLANES